MHAKHERKPATGKFPVRLVCETDRHAPTTCRITEALPLLRDARPRGLPINMLLHDRFRQQTPHHKLVDRSRSVVNIEALLLLRDLQRRQTPVNMLLHNRVRQQTPHHKLSLVVRSASVVNIEALHRLTVSWTEL